MAPVALVDRDEHGGERFEEAGQAKRPGVDTGLAGDRRGQGAHDPLGLGVVAADEYVLVVEEVGVAGQGGRGQVVERADHAAVRQQQGGLLGGAAVGYVQPERALPVETPGPAAEQRRGPECSGDHQHPRHVFRPLLRRPAQ